MNKFQKFLKPQFKIEKAYDLNRKSNGYVVNVKYWWFPVWCVANAQIITDSNLIRCNTAMAIFNNEEDAIEYVQRRYNIITYENEQQIRKA